MRELALFAGAGGGILGGVLLGWRTVCAVEIDPYARRVLLARQRDGHLGRFPIWDDVTTFEGRPWQGHVDVISGGFPCQDISVAGKGAGITGERSGLWKEFARIIREVGPRHVFVENSPALTSRGLGTVLGDLATLGYDASWGVISAADAIWIAGDPCIDHLRERIWIRGEASHFVSAGRERMRPPQPERRERDVVVARESEEDAITESAGLENGRFAAESPRSNETNRGVALAGSKRNSGSWWSTEPDVDRMVSGLPHRMDRIRCLGNAQVPAVARLAWETLKI